MNMGKPKIRFKGYTEDWEQRKLGEIITEYKETVDSDCTLPILTSSKTEGVILQEEHFGRKQQHDITGYNILPRNYCTYRNRSDGVDFTFNINKCCDKGIISKFYPVFSGKNSNVFFLSLVLNNSDEVVREIAYTCTGTGQKVLSFLDLQKMKVKVPSFDEQEEIAAYFESLDHLITLHQRKCEETKKLKKYMLQKMFPKNGESVPEIRFAGFTDAWEQRKLFEVAEFNPKSKIPDEFEYVDLESVVGTEMVSHRTETKDTAPSRAQRLAKQGDVFYQTVRPYQRNNYLYAKPDENYVFSTGYAQMRPNIDANFLMSFLQTDKFVKVVLDNCIGTSYPAINSSDLSNLEIVLPIEKAEQAKIGACFKSLDHLITLHQRKCDELKNMKKYMLQNMFV